MNQKLFPLFFHFHCKVLLLYLTLRSYLMKCIIFRFLCFQPFHLGPAARGCLILFWAGLDRQDRRFCIAL
jgi:hypothetical protein